MTPSYFAISSSLELAFNVLAVYLCSYTGILHPIFLFTSTNFVFFNLSKHASLLIRELGIGIVPYSPTGRGFFGGKAVVESLPANSSLVWIYVHQLLFFGSASLGVDEKHHRDLNSFGNYLCLVRVQ